jgi:hypothetical protein
MGEAVAVSRTLPGAFRLSSHDRTSLTYEFP